MGSCDDIDYTGIFHTQYVSVLFILNSSTRLQGVKDTYYESLLVDCMITML